MRKIYLSLTCAALAAAAMPAAAQQLPDPSFANWVDCIPWTSLGNEKAQGTTPEGWTISNVIGIKGVGATTVGDKAEGINGGNAVVVTNSPNSIVKTQTVPGYFTLGTTWSTSVMGKENDGGTFGGIKFTNRPDGIHFSYKRTVADGSNQQATVVAYLWKGTWTQANVPGNIVMAGATEAIDMVNRDRNILGMETSKGGEVTKSDDAALIAKAIRPIVATPSEWTELTIPFEYESSEAPEMFNVIFAANDYFSADNIEQGNSLTVAEPKLVYWSKLSEILIDGKALEGFDDATYEYTLGTLPAASDVKVGVLGAAATVDIKEADGKIVITVTNPEGTDEEGLSEHTYTLAAEASEPAPTPAGPGVDYTGKLIVKLMGDAISSEDGDDCVITITPNTDGTVTVLLPSLTLGDLGDLGEIKVERVNAETIDGVTTYNATVTNFPVMGGAIMAESVAVNGTTTEAGEANLSIDVVWEGMPITCSFVGQNLAGIHAIEMDNANAPVEFFDLRGIRVNPDALTPGLYIRRQGTASSKIIIR